MYNARLLGSGPGAVLLELICSSLLHFYGVNRHVMIIAVEGKMVSLLIKKRQEKNRMDLWDVGDELEVKEGYFLDKNCLGRQMKKMPQMLSQKKLKRKVVKILFEILKP